MNEIINLIIGTLIGGVFVIIGVILQWWLTREDKKSENNWNFLRDATVEILSTINLVDHDLICLGIDTALNNLTKHMHKFGEIKTSLEIVGDNEANQIFLSFYKATLDFADELRKNKMVDPEKLSSFDKFKEEKIKWINLIRKRLKIK